MTSDYGIKPAIRKIRPEQVGADLRVQRPLDEKRVREMVAKFRPEALGVPTASTREDGTLIWLDGQTRGAALKELNLGSVPIPVSVYEGLSLQQEAELFRILNDSKRLTPVDLFRIAITEGDRIAIGADRAVKVQGWVTEKGKKNSFAAVNTLYKAFEQDSGAVKLALQVLAGAWGATPQAVQAALFQGVYTVFFRYNQPHHIEADRLRDKMAKEPGGPQQFVGRARFTADTRSITVPDAVSDLVVNLYNGGSKPRKFIRLPDWQTS